MASRGAVVIEIFAEMVDDDRDYVNKLTPFTYHCCVERRWIRKHKNHPICDLTQNWRYSHTRNAFHKSYKELASTIPNYMRQRLHRKCRQKEGP